MSEAFDGTLDLTGAKADEIGFPAVPSGTYECHVGKAEWRTTENVDGTKKLPHETPYLALGIRANEDVGEVDGVQVGGVYVGWTNLYVPPADYDPAKSQRMKNMMANFLNAIGEDWQKKNYRMPDADSLVGTPLVAVVRKKYDKQRGKDVNDIEGFKPAGTAAESESVGSGSGLR